MGGKGKWGEGKGKGGGGDGKGGEGMGGEREEEKGKEMSHERCADINTAEKIITLVDVKINKRHKTVTRIWKNDTKVASCHT